MPHIALLQVLFLDPLEVTHPIRTTIIFCCLTCDLVKVSRGRISSWKPSAITLVPMYIYIYIYMITHTHFYVYIYKDVYNYCYIYICIYIYIYIYKYIYIYIYMYIMYVNVLIFFCLSPFIYIHEYVQTYGTSADTYPTPSTRSLFFCSCRQHDCACDQSSFHLHLGLLCLFVRTLIYSVLHIIVAQAFLTWTLIPLVCT